MRKVLVIFAISFTMIFSNELSAYDSTAHKRMARIALQQSILGNAEFMESLGMPELSIVADEVSDEECSDILRANNQFDPLEQFYCGAYQEDYPLVRTLNHFFDPVNDRGLIPVISNTAATWALEDIFNYPGENLQDYSHKDAVEYFFQGYTDLTEPERLGKLKHFFQVFGQVAHMVEDMASPEHVRIDQHLYPLSEYEGYVKEEVKKLPAASFQYQHQMDLNILQTARHFFSNRLNTVGLADFTNSNFISVDTNFIQLSNGDLAPSPKYLLPQPNQTLVTVDAATELVEEARQNQRQYHGLIKFISSEGYDGYAAAVGGNPHFTNNKASALNLYYYDLYNHSLGSNIRIHELGTGINRSTMKSAQNYLLRRAVSYSTGYVNYFFRGHVDIDDLVTFVDDQNVPRVTFKIKNTSSDHNSSGEAFSFSDGDFDLYYDTESGERKRANPIISAGVNNSLSSFDSLHDQDELTVEYQLNEGVWDQTKPYTLVFKGGIGIEEGVMVKVFEPYRLLSFVVDGVTGNAPVDNTIKVYSSADLGVTWKQFGSLAWDINDASVSVANGVHVFKAIYMGRGEIYLSAIYNDHLDDVGAIVNQSVNEMFRSEDYGRTWSVVRFNWNLLEVGMNPLRRISELKVIHQSLMYTGGQNLAALRLQSPLPNDPPRTPRSFQLYQTDVAGSETGNWIGSAGLGVGGLPEVEYIGGDSYLFSSVLQGQEAGPGDEGGEFRIDTVLARTDDLGDTYYPLTDLKSVCGDSSDPNNGVDICYQHVRNIGDNRLLGWVNLKSNFLRDYASYLPISISVNGGSSWASNRVAPYSPSCNPMQHKELELHELMYIGGVNTTRYTEDVVVAISSCTEIYEQNNQVRYLNNEIYGLFFTRVDRGTWGIGELPPGYDHSDSVFLFAGDNGAVPGLYDSTNVN
ncbi:MAG: hypothetical protein AB2551_02725 [Candidatus Thiodiazotropha sp.]